MYLFYLFLDLKYDTNYFFFNYTFSFSGRYDDFKFKLCLRMPHYKFFAYKKINKSIHQYCKHESSIITVFEGGTKEPLLHLLLRCNVKVEVGNIFVHLSFCFILAF